MHTFSTSPETETSEVLPPISKVTKAVIAALIAMGIYDTYQDIESCSSDSSAPMVEVQK